MDGDGSITIDIGADTEQVGQALKRVEKEIAKTQASIDSMKAKAEKMTSLGTAQKESAEYKKLASAVSNAEKALLNLYNRQEKLAESGTSKTSKTWQNLEYDIEKAERTLESLESEMQHFEESQGTKENTAAWESLQYDIGQAEEKLKSLLAQKENLQEFGIDPASFQEAGNSAETAAESITDVEEAVDSATSSAARLAATAGGAAAAVTRIAAQGVLTGMSKLGSLTLKTAAGMAKLAALTLKTATGMTRLNKAATKSGDTFGKSLVNLLKYGIGIKSLFALVNKLKSALSDSVDSLVKYDDKLNDAMSSMTSSLDNLKASLGTAFSPIITAVAPAVTELIDLLTDAVNALGQFFAALSGSTTYTQAIRTQTDYAESLESTASAAKEAVKQLAGFDKLNVLSDTSTDSSSDSSDTGTETEYETVDIASGFLELTDKIKEALADLFAPMKESWEENGEAVITALQEALTSCRETITSIGTSFMNIWTGGAGVETCNNILALLEDIFDWIGDIADAWNNAWNKDSNVDGMSVGEACIQSIFDKLNSILSLIDTISDSFAEVWNNGTGETILSNILQTVTNINNIVTGLATSFENAWESAGLGTSIIQGIADIFTTIQGYVTAITGSLAEWAGSINFEPLLTALDGIVDALQPLADDLGSGLEWLFENVLEPLGTWAAESVVPVVFEAIASALELIDAVIDAAKPGLQWLWDNFLKPVATWTGGVIVDVLGEVSGLFSGLANGDDLVYSVVNTFAKIEDEISPYLLGIGALLAASGINIPLGIALMAAGAVGLLGGGKVISENWDSISGFVQENIDTIEGIVKVGALALGAVLTFSGVSIPLGIALMAGGAIGLAKEKSLNWDSISGFVQENIDTIKAIVEAGMLALGAVLAFSGVNIPLGIALMAAGAVGLVEEKDVDWDSLVENVKESLESGSTEIVEDVVNQVTGKSDTTSSMLDKAREGIDEEEEDAVKEFLSNNMMSDVLRKIKAVQKSEENLLETGNESSSIFEKSIKGNVESVIEDLLGAYKSLEDAEDSINISGFIDPNADLGQEIEDAFSVDRMSYGGNVEVGVNLTKGTNWDGEAYTSLATGDHSTETVENLLSGSWSDMGYTAMTTNSHSTTTTAKLISGSGSSWSSNAYTALTNGNKTYTTTAKVLKATSGGWVANAFTALTNGNKTYTTTAKILKATGAGWVANAFTALTNGNKTYTTTAKLLKATGATNWVTNAWTALTKASHTTTTTAKLAKAAGTGWIANAWTALTKASHTTTTTTKLAKGSGGNWNSDAWTVLTAAANGLTQTLTIALDFAGEAWDSIKSVFGFAKGGIIRADGSVSCFASGGKIGRNGASWWDSITKYASGTVSAHGTVFVAGEAGPEIVGNVNGQTEVLNKSQIAAAIYSAVVSGMSVAVKTLGEFLSECLATCTNAVISSMEYLTNAPVTFTRDTSWTASDAQLLASLQSLTDRIGALEPVLASGSVLPYSVGAVDFTDVTDTIEASNADLITAMTSIMSNMTAQLLDGMKTYCKTQVTLDRRSLVQDVIDEINQRTNMYNTAQIKV